MQVKDEELWVESGRADELLRSAGCLEEKAGGLCLGSRRHIWAVGKDVGATCCKRTGRAGVMRRQTPGLLKVLSGCLPGADERGFQERQVLKG